MIVRDKTLIIYQWDSDEGEATSKDLINSIKTGKYTDVIAVSPQEYEVNWSHLTGHDPRYIEKCLMAYDVTLTVIYGSLGRMFPPRRDPIFNTSFIFLPLYFAYDVVNRLEKTELLCEHKKTKHGIALFNKPHDFRCTTIDYFAKKGLLEYIDYSWNILTEDYQDKYYFKHWEEAVRGLDDTFAQTGDYHNVIPTEMKSAAVQIVSESTVNGPFFTEKTFWAIARGMPFVIIAQPGMNIILEEFGFRNFTEELDISDIEDHFYADVRGDTPVNFDVYIDRITNRLVRTFENHSPEELRKKCKSKVIHNRKVLENIWKQNKFIPKQLFSLIERTGVTLDDLRLSETLNVDNLFLK